MQKEQILYAVIGLLAGSLLTIMIASNAVNNGNTGMMQMMGIRTTNQNIVASSNGIDAHFIEQMIPHHEDAITMAKLAQTKAKRTEVKQLSLNIIDSQGKEINQMKSWYKDWFGTDIPQGTSVMGRHGMIVKGGMHMGMMGDETDLQSLEQAEDFDRAFVEEMIPHHQMAVMMAQMLKNSTSRPEMKKLAQDIIDAQTKEISEMRDWYKAWGYSI